MRTSVASISKKFISTFFAATLALGLVPAAAFADNGEEVDDVILNEEVQDESVETGFTPSNGEEGIQDDIANSDDSNLSIPAAMQRVNEDVALTTRTVAQAESTRSYFLAQTLESTRTVPIVSANLPLDMTASEPQAPEADTPASDEGEESEGSDDPDLAVGSNAIAAESTVVGSFEHRGITYAVEPGGESVAVVAADYSKLPSEFIEAQTIVLPSMVTSDGIDYYSVTRIADNAFSGINANVISSDSEKSALLIQNREAVTDSTDDVEDEELAADDESTGITAITIPASVASICDDAFTNFDTLQYVIVSGDNPNYGMYDGCLYDAELTSLLLIPEGRLGAVRIAPGVTSIDPEVFSHCPSVDTLVADADSAAYQLLSGDDIQISDEHIAIATSDERADATSAVSFEYVSDKDESFDLSLWEKQQTDASSGEFWQLSAIDALGGAAATSEIGFKRLDDAEVHYSFASVKPESEVTSASASAASIEARASEYGTVNPNGTLGYNHNLYVYKTSSVLHARQNGTRVCLLEYASASPLLLRRVSSANYVASNNWGWQLGWAEMPSNAGGVMYFSYEHGIETNTPPARMWCVSGNISEKVGASHVQDHCCAISIGTSLPANIPFAYRCDQCRTKKIVWEAGEETPEASKVVLDPTTKKGALTGDDIPWPERQGWVFMGWYTQPEGQGAYIAGGVRGGKSIDLQADEVTDSSKVNVVAQADYKLYGYFVPAEHDVIFDPNDGQERSEEELAALPKIWTKWGAETPVRLKAADAPSYEPYGKPYNEATEPPETYEQHANLGSVITRQNLYVPYARPGYVFNGYWSTKYSEDPAHPETIGNSSITPRQYYDENMDTKTATNPDGLWLEESPDASRLYAHWKYRIVLDPNAYGRSGAASADEVESMEFDTSDYAAVRRDPEDEASAIDHYTDAYGNEFRLTSGGMEVLAIDRAPVMLPAVTGRVGYLDEPTDYAPDADVRAWGVKGGVYGAASGLIPHDDEGVTTDGSAACDPGAAALCWDNIDATTLDGLPYFVNKTKTAYAKPVSGDPGTVRLYQDWSSRAKRYTVTLTSDYAYGEGGSAVSFARTNDATDAVTAQYDAPLLMTRDGRTVSCVDPDLELVAPVMFRDGQHEYVFKGFYTQRNGLDTMNGEEYIASEVQGSGEDLVSTMAPTARIWRTDAASELFAMWGHAVSTLTLDLQGGELQGFGDQRTIAVMDGAEAFELTAKTPVEELPAAYRAVPTRPGYAFEGYYTKSASLAADAKTAAFATCAEASDTVGYYLNQGGSVRTAKENGSPLEWKFRTNTVLYAHWTYTIELDANPAGCADIVHEGKRLPDHSDAPGTTAGYQTDPYGNRYFYEDLAGNDLRITSVTALAGVPVKLPYATDRTGYDDTCAWSVTQDASSGTLPVDDDGFTLGTDGKEGAPAIAPDASGKVVLYADWSDAVHSYKVNLVADYDGYAPDDSYTTVMEDVVYGEPFLAAGESLVAPHIAGYRFMGYFTDKNGAGEAYTEATDNSNKGQVGCLRVNGSPKAFTVAGLENGDTVDLYASYERLEYTVRFNTDAIQPADATKVSSVVSELSSTRFSASELASYRGRLEANKHQATDLSEGFAGSSLKLHYGDALAGEHALPTPALENGRTATFWCQGYTFCGWYSFPIKADGTLNVVYTEDGMVDLKASGAIRFKAGSYGSSHPVSEEKTSFDVEIADVENPTMTLYAVWERNAYAITWDETSSLSTSSVTAPTQLAYQIALYGSAVERTAPVFRDHVFAGTWHTSAACTGAPVVLDPYCPAASSSSSPVYFAKWDGTEEHAVFFYPGAHGSFEEGPYLEAPYLYADAASVPFGPYSQALSRDAGYAFAGWREAANAEDATMGIVKDASSTPINSLSGVSGFSTRHDDIHLVAQYSARTYVIRLDANGGTELDPSSIEFKEADEGPILLPGASDMKLPGSTFVGWEYEGTLLATDEDAGVTVNVDGSASIDPHLFVFSMEDPTVLEIPLRAKWKSNAYVVRFNLWKDGSGEQGSTAAVSDVLEVPVAFGGTFEMPYPAAAAGSKRVFSHWGTSASTTRPDTTHTAWVPEAKVLFDADFLASLKTAPVYETEKDRYVLDLYAEFGRAISATLSTSASIHVDPHNPGAMIVTDTAISSDLLDEDDTALPVRVVSLSYSSIDGSGTQPGTRGAFAGSNGADSSKVKLAVYAKVEDDAFKGFTDELRDAEFVRTSIVPNSTVRFSLGDTADVRTLADLEAGGFAPFSKGKRLHIVYSLAFEDGYDESDFVSSLPDANVVGADGKSRDKYDIARVCYTIGYAPKTN